MRKILLLLLCTVMFMGVSNAQKLRWSIKGGMNVSNTHGEDSGTNPLAGIFIGGAMEYKVSEWAYGFDLLYSQKGGKSDSTLDGAIGSEVPGYHLNYISFIPTLKYYVSNSFNFQTGVEFGLNIEAERTYSGSSREINHVNDFDIGVMFGAEYLFDMGLGIIGRYCAGLNSVYDDSGSHYGREDITNGALQLGVSYRF